jgi:hypothetical protein
VNKKPIKRNCEKKVEPDASEFRQNVEDDEENLGESSFGRVMKRKAGEYGQCMLRSRH